MAITLNSIQGHPRQESYVSVARATEYFDKRLNSTAWTGTEDQKKALIEATRRIDAYRFKGEPFNTNQALKFPRTENGISEVAGVIDSATTTTVVDIDLSRSDYEYFNDYFNNWGIKFLSGNLKDKYSAVTDFVQSTGTLTIDTIGTPDSGSSFVLIPEPPMQFIAAVCEEALALLNGDIEDVDPDVQSYSVSNYSETRRNSSRLPTLSPKAAALLEPFINRGGRII